MKWSTAKRIFVMFIVNRILSGTDLFESKRKLLNSVGFRLGEGTKVVGPFFAAGP